MDWQGYRLMVYGKGGPYDTPSMCQSTAPVKLLRDQPTIPAQQGVGGGNGGDRFEACATERMSERREAPAFGVGEPQPLRAEFGFENAILLLKAGDYLLLVPLNPAGDHRNEHMENHSRSSGWRP